MSSHVPSSGGGGGFDQAAAQAEQGQGAGVAEEGALQGGGEIAIPVVWEAYGVGCDFEE